MRWMWLGLIPIATTLAMAQSSMPQPIASAEERVSDIVAKLIVINARMGVELDQLRLALAKEKERADAAEKKLQPMTKE